MKDVLCGTFSCNAIAASAVWQDSETLEMLCKWADLIVPVVPRDFVHVGAPDRDNDKWKMSVMWNTEFASKVRVANLGEDVWGNARHPELRALCVQRAPGILEVKP
jgi:hypothetical protein